MRLLSKQCSAASLLLLILIATLAYRAGGAAMLAGQPTSIVTVNLGAVMEKLNQRANAAANVNSMAEKIKAEVEKKNAEFGKMKADVDAVIEAGASSDDPARQALQEKLMLERLKFEAWHQTALAKLDIEESLLLQDLYRNIKREAAQLATDVGYDVVLVDDSQGELSAKADPRVPRRVQVMQQIAGRRLLHVNKTIDITDDLIQRMNNAEKAMGPKPAPK
jgi:Skp family chaperone for outer membrane proteins